MVIKIVLMEPMSKTAPTPNSHHRRRPFSCQLAMIGCSSAETIVACHIGGNAMGSMIAVMVPMNWDVQMLQKVQPPSKAPSFPKSALTIDSSAIPDGASRERMFAMASQTVHRVKTKRIARRIFVDGTSSGMWNPRCGWREKFSTNSGTNLIK